MTAMGKHSPTEAAGRRARACAWAVFIGMAGTTMSFQVYHSIKHGHMPWPLAVLYGVVPLLISMLVIEVVSGWDDAPKWAAPVSYLIIGGAMFLSAAATGAVVLKAAPPHSSLLFGFLLDGAAILAARFLMTAVKRAAAAQLAALQSAAGAERAARLEAETASAALREELEAAQQGRAALAADLEAAQAALKAVQEGGTSAAPAPGTRKPVPPRHKPASAAPRRAKDPEAQAAEVVTRVQAELILDAEPDISGSELGRRLGVLPGYGRKLKRELTRTGAGGAE